MLISMMSMLLYAIMWMIQVDLFNAFTIIVKIVN